MLVLPLALLSALLLGNPLSAALPAAAAAGDPARTVAAAAADDLERDYVLPTPGRAAAELLRRNAAAGGYDGLREAELAARLSADLAPVLHDKHVRVRWSPDRNPPAGASGGAPSAEELAAGARREREGGYGLGRVAHLPGNVGYIEVRGFASAPETDAVLDAAVNAVASSDAIVLDLRRNHGGDPHAVARLVSHFVEPKTHLNDFLGRGDGAAARIESSTYSEAVPGPRVAAPLYVLTSGETFSGGEECAYDLQALERGTLIGAVTGGGANPGGVERIDDHFGIFVPTERARNPITHANWEGVGVRPDRALAPERALATAYAAALDARLADPALARSLRERLAALRTTLDTLDDAAILAL